MIRSALIALGLSAGAAQGQGMVPTAPLLETCGGVELVLTATDVPDAAALDLASDVVSARVGGVFSQVFDYADVEGDEIKVSLTSAMIDGGADRRAIEPLLQHVSFAFHQVLDMGATGQLGAVTEDQIILPSMQRPDESFVLNAMPILDGGSIASAKPGFDRADWPVVYFSFDADGARVFGDYTANNIGKAIAIVLDGQVLSAPIIQSAILGGEGMISGDFTVVETEDLALKLQGGVLPFDLNIVREIAVDGSNPSADFCP